MAFCSGNTTGLLISVIKATGNNLQLLENKKMTMGLQVEQNNQILGVFDLNLNDTINQYKIGSFFRDHRPDYSHYGTSGVGDKILMLGNVIDYNPGGNYGCSNCAKVPTTMMVSRWAHLEFLITNSGIAAKIEGVDIPVIDTDDTNSDKETWPLEIPISGFHYDNIRFYNRTYYTDVFPDWEVDPNNNLYYGKGAVTLVDDVTLIDDVGQPSFWLGPSSKVVPLSPGIDTNLDNNGVISDGLREWGTNSSSHRRALKNFDGDIGIIETTISGAITAVRYDNHNFGGDGSSAWRTSFNDGIAGLKIYNNVRKNFLDTEFTNVFFTGVSDNTATYTSLLIKTDRDIYDVTNKNTITKILPVSLDYNTKKFDDPSIVFPTNDSYLTMPYGSLYRSESSAGFPYPRPDNVFTIESWVYFQNGNENINLYSKKPPVNYPQIPGYRLDIPSTNFEFVCTTGYIQYNTYIDDALLGYRRLYFSSPIPTGTWNHVALVNDAIQDFRGSLINNVRYYNHQYRLITYLNGVSGTAHSIWNSLDTNLDVYTNGNPYNWSPFPVSYSSQNLELTNSGINILYQNETLNGIGNNLSPITGLWTEYFPSINVSYNNNWQNRINYPQTITVTNLNYSYNGLYTYYGFINAKPAWVRTSGAFDGYVRNIRWDGDRWFMGYRDLDTRYGGYANNNDTTAPLIYDYTNTNGWYDVGHGGMSTQAVITYNLPTTTVLDLVISKTRCNNKPAYLISQAALPEITSLYCYNGIYNNAYVYQNIDNPNYYIYNPYWWPWSSDDSRRRWIIASGLVPQGSISSHSGIKYVLATNNITTDTLLTCVANQTSHLKIMTSGSNNNNTTFTILKNNISQYNLNRNSDGVLSGVLPVISGDIISVRANYGSYPSLTNNNSPSLSLSLSLSSPIQSGVYYLPTEWVSTQSAWWQTNMPYFSRPSTIVGKFLDDYTSTSTSNNRFPLFIGGDGKIDNYRFTHGTSYTQGLQSRTRYWQNFSVPSEPFPSVYDDYAQIGQIHNLTRTRYNTIQYFAMNDPSTQQPWSTGLVVGSGFLFGVKKL